MIRLSRDLNVSICPATLLKFYRKHRIGYKSVQVSFRRGLQDEQFLAPLRV